MDAEKGTNNENNEELSFFYFYQIWISDIYVSSGNSQRKDFDRFGWFIMQMWMIKGLYL